MDLIALAIPVFFLLIGVELVVAHLQGEKLYRLNDALSDLSCGILQQVLGVFGKVVVFGAYVALYERDHLFEIGAGSAWAWIGCFLGVDFLYYWFHRISHEVNLPWGAHIVHHSSEEYNLAVALRQGALQPFFSFLFYLPLAWIGFPPLVFLACSSVDTLYQFWIHTRTVGKLGPLEWVLNTPSHHRVHHGCDAKYIDKNYAGTFIVWDRLFGTFQVEEEEPIYGITKPLASWNPLWANVHYYADLVALGRRAPSWRERLRLWIAAPAFKPAWAKKGPGDADRPTPLTAGEAGKYDENADPSAVPYAMVGFVLAIALTVALLFAGDRLDRFWQLSLAVLVAWTLVGVGALFERRPWAAPSELARLGALWILALRASRELSAGLAIPVVVAVSLALGGLAAWLLARRRRWLAVASPPAATLDQPDPGLSISGP